MLVQAYEVPKPSEAITADRYRQQMIKLDRAVKDIRRQYDRRHDKVILQHDNARPHVAKMVQETLKVLNWEILPHPPYSPDIVPSDYHLFRAMHSALLGARFSSRKSQNGSTNGLLPRNPIVFIAESICCLIMGKRCTFQWKVFWMKYVLFYYFNFCFTFYKKNGENLVVHQIFKNKHWTFLFLPFVLFILKLVIYKKLVIKKKNLFIHQINFDYKNTDWPIVQCSLSHNNCI